MIKLIDLLIEQWDTKTMGKPLTKAEISALKKKLKAPSVRKGPKKQLVPPNLSDREKHHVIFVMLKKRRDKAYKKSGGQMFQKHWTKLSKAEKEKLGEIAVRPKPTKFKDIYNALPSDLKKRVWENWRKTLFSGFSCQIAAFILRKIYLIPNSPDSFFNSSIPPDSQGCEKKLFFSYPLAVF